MILTIPTKNLRKRSNTYTAETYGVTIKTQTRNSESKKARNLETKRPRNQETQKPRDAEAKKPINQETEKPRHASQAPANLHVVLDFETQHRPQAHLSWWSQLANIAEGWNRLQHQGVGK